MFEFATAREVESPRDMRIRIKKYLDEKGVRHALHGYDYLLTAGEICLKDRNAKYLTCAIYQEISKRAGSTPSRIERAIRHALQDCTDITMKNSEFICRMVDDLEDEV